jgi:hypothetical protein
MNVTYTQKIPKGLFGKDKKSPYDSNGSSEVFRMECEIEGSGWNKFGKTLKNLHRGHEIRLSGDQSDLFQFM